MVQLWEMDPYFYGDSRLPHFKWYCQSKLNNPDELTKRTGVVYYKLDLEDAIASSKRIHLMKKEWKFQREDTYILDDLATIDFKDKIEELFVETKCGEDQARMVIEGSAYIDVEEGEDMWIRICLEHGDLIIIPHGKPHRMTTTNKNYVKMRRFFKEEVEV